MPTITLVIPTISRPTLARTLRSIRVQPWGPGDEVLLVGDGSQPIARELFEQFRLPGRYVEVPRTLVPDWGHTPRNTLIHQREARGEYLAALDDDDEWTPDALATIRAALADAPGRPHIFRMTGAPIVGDVWKVREIAEQNVGTPMLVTPNDPTKLGRYALRYGGDHSFIWETCHLHGFTQVWREEVIARIRPTIRAA